MAGVQLLAARFVAAASKTMDTIGVEATIPSISGKLRTMYEVRWQAASCYRCRYFLFLTLHLDFGFSRV